MEHVLVARPAPGLPALQPVLEREEVLGGEERAQLVLAEELAQARGVQVQRAGAPLGGRCVAVVDHAPHPREEQRGREGRGAPRRPGHGADPAGPDAVEDPAQGGQVEDVLQALAEGLEHEGEVALPERDLEEVRAAPALRPERGPLAGVPARQQQGARRVLAEARGEERRVRELAHHEVLHLVGRRQEELQLGRGVGLGEAEDDPVVGVHAVDGEAQALLQASLHRDAPGRVDAGAVGREQAHAPVPDLVEEGLDDDEAIGGDLPQGLALAGDPREQVLGGALREARLLAQARGRGLRLGGVHLAHEAADGLAQLGVAAGPVPPPEREGPRLAGRRLDEHPIVRDLEDAPGGGAELEHVARAGLVHHLLVELADAPGRSPLVPREEDPVEAAVGDRPAVDDGHALGATTRRERPGQAVPDEARAQA